MKIDITSFTGEVLRLDSHLLDDTQSEAAVDCRLTNGSLHASQQSARDGGAARRRSGGLLR
ncbi:MULTISPECIES: hypothetical protein [unclassified Endozoicomonas]|uniref:hypothetical protein n=1 Tax=unclassified Endozoicomonas TaxID=2644528 RepID=UPI003BB77726